MPILNTAQFTLTGMTAKRSLGDRLQDRWVTVKDFGAVGDGDEDDTEAIQDTFDYAFGTFEDPNGFAHSELNHTVFFPRGLYKISAPIVVPMTYWRMLIRGPARISRGFSGRGPQ